MKTTEINNVDQQLVEMAAILGLDKPVKKEVLIAAIADSTYAHNLLVCRRQPDFLEHLIANPPRVVESADSKTFTTVALLTKAAESLASWAKTGFSTVSEEIYQMRLMACYACSNLRIPPKHQQSLYAIAGADANKRSVCGKCGCVVTVKARRTSDTCPDPHPNLPGLNRWNEPVELEG